MRNLIVIVMVVMLVVVLPATSTGVEYTITTADGNGADTTVQENDENNNNGSSAGMWARWNQGSSRNDHIVLRFDLSGIIGTITNATLNLIKNEDNDPTGPNYIYGVSNGVSGDALADWSETGLTWNNCDWLDRDAPYDDNDLDSTKLTPAFGATFSTAGNKGETKSFSHADLLSFLTDDNNDLVTLVLIRKYNDSPDTDMDQFAAKDYTPSGGSLGDWAPHLVLMTDSHDPLPELSETTVYENDPPGTSVGTLSIDNAVGGKTYTFSLPAGVFSNDFFEITVGATTNIRTKVFLDDGVMSPLRIVATEFSGGATYTNDLYTIVASAVNTPTFIASASVAPTAQNNDVVATLKSRASNGSVTYTVPAGRNDIFKISGAELQVKDNTLLGAVSTTNYVALVATDDNDGSADKLIVEVVTENAASAGAVFMFR